jgi:uncharacterized metal-binding protein YceD (DUF177 family)
MNPLKEFSIPIKGLKQEHYEFDFQLDKSFFACFDDSPVTDSDISVYLDLDKRTSMMELFFDIQGTVKTECDRCLASIDLPISCEDHLVVKYSEEPQEDTDEIVFIHPDASEFNVAQYIYEYICLAVPFTKVYDCENDETPPCDNEMLNKINGISNQEPQAEEDTQSLGNLLKNININ